MTPKSGVMFLKNSPLCRGHVSENGVGNVSEKHALKRGHDPDKSHPKMLRPYFMRNRELLADLAPLAYETIQQLMADAVGDENARPGVVAVPQTSGSVVNVHPHAHCLAML